jgi:hypothetical protein
MVAATDRPLPPGRRRIDAEYKDTIRLHMMNRVTSIQIGSSQHRFWKFLLANVSMPLTLKIVTTFLSAWVDVSILTITSQKTP